MLFNSDQVTTNESKFLNLSITTTLVNQSISEPLNIECHDYTDGHDNQPKQLYVNLSTFWYCFLALITTFGLLVSSISNMIIIYLFTSTPSLRKNPSNIIAINLSISDMLYCIQWPSVIYCCLTQTTWILEYNFVCRSLGFVTVSTALVSILTVVTMSVERAIVVMYSIDAKNHLTTKFAWCMIILIWFICICSCIPPLFGKFNRYTLDPSRTSCTLDYLSTHTDHKLYILVLYIGYYFVPMIAITISYSIIIATFNKSSLSLKEVTACNDELVNDIDNNNIISSSSIYSRTEINFFPPIQTAIASVSAASAIMPLGLSSSLSSTSSSSSASRRVQKTLRDSMRLKNVYMRKRKKSSINNDQKERSSQRSNSFLPEVHSIVGLEQDDNSTLGKEATCGSCNNNQDNNTNVSCITSSKTEMTTTTSGILTRPAEQQGQSFQTKFKRTSTSVHLTPKGPNSLLLKLEQNKKALGELSNDSFESTSIVNNDIVDRQQKQSVSTEKRFNCKSRSSVKSLKPGFYRTLSLINNNNNNNISSKHHVDNLHQTGDENEKSIINAPYRSEKNDFKRFNKFNKSLASVNNSGIYCLTQKAKSDRARSALQFRLAKMSFYLILLWLISWSPIAWLAMINSILKCRRASATAVFIASLMTKMNYFNSFLYTLSQPKLKTKFISIIKRIFCVNFRK